MPPLEPERQRFPAEGVEIARENTKVITGNVEGDGERIKVRTVRQRQFRFLEEEYFKKNQEDTDLQVVLQKETLL